MEYNYYIIIIATFLGASAVFNLILYFGFNKNSAYLHLAFFCISQMFKALSERQWILNNFNESYLDIAFIIHVTSFVLSGFFLVAFILKKFEINNFKILFWPYFVLSFVLLFTNLSRPLMVIMIAYSGALVLYALYKKYEGSIYSLVGIIGFAVWTYIGYLGFINSGYLLGVVFFVFSMNLALAKQIARQNEQRNQALIRASRLESQMLKKNIQPHFILNSLTSLQELVEHDPQKAVDFIDSLAEEFQVVSKVSGEKLIPITDELKICEAHLKIMGFRKNAEFELKTKNFTGDEMVPPAIFHTLVENGLTHGYSDKRKGYFELTKTTLQNGIKYTLFNDSELKQDKFGKGTGLKYVEARLEETYPGMWQLNASPVEDGWKVEIEIYNGKLK